MKKILITAGMLCLVCFPAHAQIYPGPVCGEPQSAYYEAPAYYGSGYPVCPSYVVEPSMYYGQYYGRGSGNHRSGGGQRHGGGGGQHGGGNHR